MHSFESVTKRGIILAVDLQRIELNKKELVLTNYDTTNGSCAFCSHLNLDAETCRANKQTTNTNHLIIMKKILYLLLTVLVSCSLPLITSCDDDDDVERAFFDINLEPDQTFSIPNASNVTWTSSNPAVATVNEKAIVTGISVGTTEISSTLGTFTATVAYQNVSLKVDSVYLVYNGYGVEWESSNPLIASVIKPATDADTTRIVATCAGTTVLSSSRGTITVTVSPQYTIYEEPFTKWGADETAIKEALSKYTPYTSTETQIVYQNIGVISAEAYTLKDSALVQVDLAIPVDTFKVENVAEHLENRYKFYGIEDDIYLYYSPTLETAVLLSLQADSENPYFLLDYIPYDAIFENVSAVPQVHGKALRRVRNESVVK